MVYITIIAYFGKGQSTIIIKQIQNNLQYKTKEMKSQNSEYFITN